MRGLHRSKKEMTEEDRLSLAKSLFSDFLASGDLAEGLTAAREIVAPGTLPAALSPNSSAYMQMS